jgi:hypothetical protein
MRFGQTQSESENQSPNYQKILAQLSEGQHRLIYLESQMKKYKAMMIILTIISLVVVMLNKGCKNERKTK